jgi:pimeloyl-ACP methyl ester carboxylesterase
MAPYEQHEVTYSDGKKIFYHAAGPANGPLLMFIHGWPAIGKLWKPQIDAFSAMGFRVVAPDMPGMWVRFDVHDRGFGADQRNQVTATHPRAKSLKTTPKKRSTLACLRC